MVVINGFNLSGRTFMIEAFFTDSRPNMLNQFMRRKSHSNPKFVRDNFLESIKRKGMRKRINYHDNLNNLEKNKVHDAQTFN